MRIIHVTQRSEAWEALRARPTASEFGRFCTPARGDYAAGAEDYAAEIITRRLGLHVPAPPSFWMEWGIEQEPAALEAYTAKTGRSITEAGFILPDHTDAYGGSPDGLVGPDGLIEVKCPRPEKIILWRSRHKKKPTYFPREHKAQVQGLLWISQRKWLDFFAFHPGGLELVMRVEPDLEYHAKLESCMELLLIEIAEMEQED